MTPRRNAINHLVVLQLAAVSVVVLLVTGACHTTAKPPYATDILLINLEVLKHVLEVRYSMGDEHFVIRPANANNDLVVAKLDVHNRVAAQVFMNVNQDALTLRNKESPYEEYKAIDPFQQRERVDGNNPEENEYMPFIWGPVELPQKCADANDKTQACRLYGWVVFETPRDAQFNQLMWSTGDTVFVNF
ncbi:MAG: hypothetical protein Q8O40_06505 [Chloroflexota bacterium]|nr:hypothetical protein [Chloroflexota bacterium]